MQNFIEKINESNLEDAVKADLISAIEAGIYDDVDLDDFDPEYAEVCCMICGRSKAAGDFCDLDGMCVCEECRNRAAAKDAFHGLIDAVQDVIEESGWDIVWKKSSVAATGTRYYTINRYKNDDEEEVETLVIRVADHGECYCREDYDVSPTGLTVTQLREVLGR